jgi:hypothetical protein
MQIIILTVRLFSVVGVLVLAASTPDSVDHFSRTFTIGPSTGIRIEATIAEVTIAGSDRQDASIEVVRRAPASADLARYPVVVDERPGELRVAVVQAHEGRSADLRTEITIAAPARAILRAVRVFEGRVRVSNLLGTCDVDLQRGAIEATHVAGRVRLEAGLGSIDVKDAELTPGGMMRLRVFNGPLRVRLAKRPANARILAVTFNGTLTSDIPLTMKDRFGPRFGETTLGSGDPVMSLDVVKGDIAISAPK